MRDTVATQIETRYRAMSDESLECYFTIRLSNRLKKEFLYKASKYGSASDVLREIMQALIDGRLVIQPDETKETLYARTSN